MNRPNMPIRIALAAVAASVLATGCEIQGSEKGRPPFVPGIENPYSPPTALKKTRTFVLLHTNDEHSQLLGAAPNLEYTWLPKADGAGDMQDVLQMASRVGGDTQTRGGIVRRQYLVNKIRSETTDPVLLVSAGDSTMGTLFHAAGDKGAPDYVAMALLGYDFVTLGNHEFDFGPDYLAKTLKAARTTVFGGAVPVVASNIHFDKDLPGDDSLQALYSDQGDTGATIARWATKTLANGLKVGVLGLMGYEAALVSAGKGPVSFSIPPALAAYPTKTACDAAKLQWVRGGCVNPLDEAGHVGALIAEVQPQVDRLRSVEKVDVVLVLSHLGSREDEKLAQLTTGIDVIVGGHSHEELPARTIASTLPAGGKSIVVQAGSYGAKLGKLTLAVAPSGAVAFDPEESALLAVDHTLDAAMFGNTDLQTGTLSPEFERALQLTGAIIEPVLAQLDGSFSVLLDKYGLASLLSPAVASGHSIVGDGPGVGRNKDTNLMHLVTDAARTVVAGGACLARDPANTRIIAVQANGVIRDSLHFTSDEVPAASALDLFRVLPLGASPFETTPAPGYPVVVFRLSLLNLFAGADIGVTKGLESDSFFLDYSGLRVTYDEALPPFDPAAAAKLSPLHPAPDPAADPKGRIVTLEYVAPDGTEELLYQFDASKTWAERWAVPMTDEATVITNLYLAGYLSAFGLTAEALDGGAIASQNDLYKAAICQTGQTPDCAASTPVPGLMRCVEMPGTQVSTAGVKWAAPVPELKEWQILISYLRGMPVVGGVPTIPAPFYASPDPAKPWLPANPRVMEAADPE